MVPLGLKARLIEGTYGGMSTATLLVLPYQRHAEHTRVRFVRLFSDTVPYSTA